MGEANFYYFTCLNYRKPVDDFKNSQEQLIIKLKS